MTIHIKIGDVETLRTEKWDMVPDDRQTRIDTIGGVEVQDFGYVPEGDTFTCSITVEAAGFEVICQYWHNREFVTVRDVSGREIPHLRPVVKKYGYIDNFEETSYRADMEFWRK